MWSPLTADGTEVFGLAVYQCLQRWTALQLAIHNGWGGSSPVLKVQQLQSDIVACTPSKQIQDIYQLEKWLDKRLVELFSTEIEDGSLFEVAEQIMTMHKESILGNYENVTRLSTPAPGSGQSVLDSRGKVVKDEGEISIGNQQDSGDEEGMDMEQSLPTAAIPSSSTSGPTTRAPLLTEEEMADGWQEAPVRKGRRGKTLQ